MHGLINRSIQLFLTDTYGQPLWAAVARSAGLGAAGFETMVHYDDRLTDAVLVAAAEALAKPMAALLEDMGGYLVSREPLRRLLRFGGVDYRDFLLSLDELKGRGELALPDLDLPELLLHEDHAGSFLLEVRSLHAGWGPVVAGVLRAMADDYGALALIDRVAGPDGVERVTIELLEARYASGRAFELTPAPR